MASETVLVRFYDRVLQEEAFAAAQRAAEARAQGDTRAHTASVFVAIVTAASSAEFYLSEILAHLENVRLIDRVERDRVRSRDRVWKKFNALAKIFHREIHDEPYYRPYCALVVLRNCLVHRSAEFLPLNQWPADLEDYREMIPHVAGDQLDWTSQLLDADTARWAVEAARSFVDAVHAIVPDPAGMGA
jgi:hypothetical protein